MITCAFAALVLAGTLLLSLPAAARSGEAVPFVDALLTSTSASCVTGLVVYDTYTHWSMFGQIVILLLIQVGGIGIITLSMYFFVDGACKDRHASSARYAGIHWRFFYARRRAYDPLYCRGRAADRGDRCRFAFFFVYSGIRVCQRGVTLRYFTRSARSAMPVLI